MLISLVVPCYNEEESLPIFYKEASKIAQQMGISHGADFEFIFVDDGSKDLSEGARSAYSGAESLANGIDSFKKQADKLLDEMFTIDLDNLTMFVKKGDNVRIAGAAGDVVMNKYAGLGVGVILMALLTYVISVFVIHQIQRESSVIGALYAPVSYTHLTLPTIA